MQLRHFLCVIYSLQVVNDPQIRHPRSRSGLWSYSTTSLKRSRVNISHQGSSLPLKVRLTRRSPALNILTFKFRKLKDVCHIPVYRISSASEQGEQGDRLRQSRDYKSLSQSRSFVCAVDRKTDGRSIHHQHVQCRLLGLVRSQTAWENPVSMPSAASETVPRAHNLQHIFLIIYSRFLAAATAASKNPIVATCLQIAGRSQWRVLVYCML